MSNSLHRVMFNRPVRAEGRNGVTKQHGISFYDGGDIVVINALRSPDVMVRGFYDIPLESIENVIAALRKIQRKHHIKVPAPRVLVVVEGGVVQDVLADGPIQVLIKDWDNIQGDPDEAADFLKEDWQEPDKLYTPKGLDRERKAGVDKYVSPDEAHA